jgi:WD40 repeat protein
MFLLPALSLLVLGAAPPQPVPDKPFLLLSLEKGHPKQTVRGADFSPDGKTLASVCDGGVLNLWDVATGKQIHTAKHGAFDHVEFSRDGKHLVTAGTDRLVRLFDGKTGKELKTFTGHTGQVYVARFTPDGKQIVSSGIDTVTRIWDVESGKQVRTLPTGTCYGLAVSPDGKYAVAAGSNPLVLWELATGNKVREFNGHTGVVVWIAFSKDGRTIASCSYDNTVRLWETRTGKFRLTVTNQNNSPRAVYFAPGGRHFATTGYDGSTRLYEAGSPTDTFTDKSIGKQGYALTISRDGRRLCAGGENGKLFVWDVSMLTRKKVADAELSASAFDDAWKELGSDNAEAAYKNVMALSVPGALRLFTKRLTPPKPLSDDAKKRTPQLLKELADDDEDKWRKASDELAGYGPAILPALKAAQAKETDPDVKLRLVVTIRRADAGAADEARLLRTVETLERIGTAEAVKLLRELAKGDRGDATAAEAKASLGRLEK